MPKSRFINPLELLEEAHKSWDYFVSDEIVYEGKLSDIKSPKILPTWIDDYRRGDFWFELVGRLRCSFGGQEHTREHEHRLVLLMYADSSDSRVVPTKSKLGVDEGWRDDSVFVPIRQISKVAEHYVFRPIPTVIRLKLLNLHMRSRREKANIIQAETTDMGIARRQTLASEREQDAFGIFGRPGVVSIGGTLVSERPSDMVKGCPQIRQNVPNDQGPIFLRFGLNSYRYDIAKAVKFACFPNGDLWLEQAVDTPFESLDVYIRPLNLEPSAIKWMHLLFSTDDEV